MTDAETDLVPPLTGPQHDREREYERERHTQERERHQRKESRWSVKVATLSMVVAGLAIITALVVGSLALALRTWSEEQVDNLRRRATTAEADVACLRRAIDDYDEAPALAARALGELVIEMGEQITFFIQGLPIQPDPARDEITDLRAAYRATDQAAVELRTACPPYPSQDG